MMQLQHGRHALLLFDTMLLTIILHRSYNMCTRSPLWHPLSGRLSLPKENSSCCLLHLDKVLHSKQGCSSAVPPCPQQDLAICIQEGLAARGYLVPDDGSHLPYHGCLHKSCKPQHVQAHVTFVLSCCLVIAQAGLYARSIPPCALQKGCLARGEPSSDEGSCIPDHWCIVHKSSSPTS